MTLILYSPPNLVKMSSSINTNDETKETAPASAGNESGIGSGSKTRPAQIISWGTTTGKLYLDNGNVKDTKNKAGEKADQATSGA
jgi:hypothetical protein